MSRVALIPSGPPAGAPGAAEAGRTTPRPSLPRRLARRLWRLTITLLAIIGFVTVVRPFLFDITPMNSGSMAPALQGDAKAGDWVLAEKLSYYFRAPRRWEVVEFQSDDGVQVMKRVAAFPGETIAVRKNQLHINGSAAAPPTATPVTYFAYGNLGGTKPYEVTNGYYVLGDDSGDSQDSRYDGPIADNRIRARAWLIVWPPSRIGFVR